MRTRKILIIGLFAAMLISIGLLFWPLFPLLPTPAMRGLVLAPLYGAIVSVLLRRANFEGSLVLFSLVTGAIMIVFTPFLLPVTLSSGLVSELAGLAIGRLGGHKPWSKSGPALLVAAILFTALQFPLMLFILALFAGPGGEVFLHPAWIVIFSGIGATLGWTGYRLGYAVEKRISNMRKNEPNEVMERHTGEK